jgi:DNA-binding NtrC family response regulator
MISQLLEATSDSPSRARQAEGLAEDAVEGCEAQAARDSPADSGLSGRVLVVDDEPAMRSLLAAAVRGRGLECDLAANATDAIARIEQQAYDVIVVDVMLPDFSGLKVIAAIGNGSRATGVIVITGYGDVKTATEALRAQADDYLLKPFKISEFLASLERSLERRKALRSRQMTQQQLTEQVAHLHILYRP